MNQCSKFFFISTFFFVVFTAFSYAGTEADADEAEIQIIKSEKIAEIKKREIEEANAIAEQIVQLERQGKSKQDLRTFVTVGGKKISFGFYAGGNIDKDFLRFFIKDPAEVSKKFKGKKFQQIWGQELFAGYNFVFKNFIFGLDCFLSFFPANVSKLSKNPKYKRKYCFGIEPRVGYSFSDNFSFFVNLGVARSKYQVEIVEQQSDVKTLAGSKYAIMLIGLALEQNIGSIFVRAGCDKILDRDFKNLRNKNDHPVGGYVVKIGAGYRF